MHALVRLRPFPERFGKFSFFPARTSRVDKTSKHQKSDFGTSVITIDLAALPISDDCDNSPPSLLTPPDSARRAPHLCFETFLLDRGGLVPPPLDRGDRARPVSATLQTVAGHNTTHPASWSAVVSLKKETQGPPGSHLCLSSEPFSDELNSHVNLQNRLLAARQRH